MPYDKNSQLPMHSDKYIAKNSIQARNNCFHLFLNENYKSKHAHDIVKAILKVENYYKK